MKETSGSIDEIWQSDGTDAGTRKIRDIPPDPEYFTLGGIARYDTINSYFYASTRYASGTVEQLYGTNITDDIPNFKLLESEDFNVLTSDNYLSKEDWFLYVNSTDTTAGMRAYNLEEDLRILYSKNLRPSEIDPLFIGNQGYVPVSSSNAGLEPGMFMLGEEMITLLKDVYPGATGSKPHFFNIGESVYFLGNSPDVGYGIYRTDGTSAGTSFYTDLHNRIDPRRLRQIQKISGEILATEGTIYNLRLNQEKDSLEAISPPDGTLNSEGVSGFRAYFSIPDGQITFISQTTTFSIEDIFPNVIGITKPVAFVEEFAFLMTENETDWLLVFINPLTQTGRRLPLDSNLSYDWESIGMFVAGAKLHFLAVEPDGTKTIFDYDEDIGLQRSTESLSSSERITSITPGLKDESTLIRTYAQNEGSRYRIYDKATNTFTPQGIQDPNNFVYGVIARTDQLLVMRKKQLYLSTSKTDLTPALDGMLLDETDTNFDLTALTYIFEGSIFFVRSNIRMTELWCTNGTMDGTKKIAGFEGSSFFIRNTQPIPLIPGWLLLSVDGETGIDHILYNYETGAIVVKPSNQVVNAYVVSLKNRFYFIRASDRGAKKLYYLEEVKRGGEAGIVFKDENGNGLWEPEEDGLANNKVRFQFPGEEILTYSSGEGEYPRFYSPEETYQVIIEPDVCWEVTTDSIVDLTDSITTPDFGLAPRLDFYDLSAKVFSGPIRCAFKVPFWLVVTNSGCQDLTEITIDFELDPEAVFISADLPPNEIMGEQLRWNNVTLAAGETWRNRIMVTMPDEVRLGSIVPFNVSSNGRTDLGSITMDTFFYTPTLRCAIDPNDKLVTPARPEETNSNYTQIDETLTYTIRFQNTGNDTALNVRLEDHLAAELDLNTFKPIAASHEYRVELEETGRLKVYFDNIFLPDSNVNETASHGFFAFDIALKEESLNTTVENTAGIFFDFNAPVITNTVANNVVEFLDEDQDDFFFWEDCDDQNPDINPAAIDIGGNGIDEDCNNRDWTTSVSSPLPGTLRVFPNPTPGAITLTYSLPDQLLITVFDGRGRRMQTQELSSSGDIDLSSLPAAIYHLRVMSITTGQFVTRRLAKW